MRADEGISVQLARLTALVERLQAKLDVIHRDMKPEKPLLTAVEAGRFLGSTTVAIRKAALRGTLPVVRHGRRVWFRRSDLEKRKP